MQLDRQIVDCVVGGDGQAILLRQLKRIDAFNARQNKIRALKSAEVDILEDGKLDYADAVRRILGPCLFGR